MDRICCIDGQSMCAFDHVTVTSKKNKKNTFIWSLKSKSKRTKKHKQNTPETNG